MTAPTQRFPSNFLWGTATASYQIEGAGHEDGRGESIWDRFAATPNAVRNAENGSIACDFYHRYHDDIALMRDLGINAFRFSIAWPRIIPHGMGRIEQRGLDFYDRLVDELLAAGIQPFATLYHWDLPQVLEDRGGWPNRDTAQAFVEYTDVVTRRLGDRVAAWATHNEPWCAAWLGYGWGQHAPGRRSDRDALAAAHHLLLSHGWSVDVIRRNAPAAAAGIVLNLTPVGPATASQPDAEAAGLADRQSNGWFLNPLFRGRYPDDVAAQYGDTMPTIEAGDMEAIATPIDFVGVNTYSRAVVGVDDKTGQTHRVPPPSAQYTDMGWEVYPDCLYDILTQVHRDYAVPALYVTENGAAFPDVLDHEGRVRDPERRAYLQSHIASAGKAIAEGVPLAGYFAWSFLDNYEWQHGYNKRFGLVYVDYPTQRRIPKSSFEWYRDFIAQHKASAGAEHAA